MSTVTIQTHITVDDVMNIIRQLKPIEKQQLFEKVKAELTANESPLPESLKTEAWAQQADASTQRFLALCGSWEDSRSADEIVDEIYQLRTTSRTEMTL
jgi:hypothetical protein